MKRNQSSGDLTADRRAEYAAMLSESGDHAAAMELMEQALELAPGWAAGWFRLAEYAEKAGDIDAALRALDETLRLSERDVFGAGLRRAALEKRTPDLPPSAWVEALFDDYADRFDQALVERLGYSVPGKLAALIRRGMGADQHFALAVDLGCGTGLLGVEIGPFVDQLEGYDLSEGMLAKAGQKGVYQALGRADLSLAPEASGVFGQNHRADLVAAADVMMYLGDLDAAFANAAALVKAGGIFAFSVEKSAFEGGFELRESLRYAHSAAHVTAMLLRHGFSVEVIEESQIRLDAGSPIIGLLFLARNAIS